jgi:hypothetical protein
MTNRQEVARKLRESGKWLDSGDTGSIREAFYLIEQDIEAPQGREFAPFFDRLADLIDPTCSVDITEQHEIENVTRYTAECCGARMVRDRADA